VDRSGLSGRIQAWIERDREDFRAESQDTTWAAWFFAQCLLWALGLTVLATLAAFGRPMWSLISALISTTGGLGLYRAYCRRRGRQHEGR
jgi:hypothetical protein